MLFRSPSVGGDPRPCPWIPSLDPVPHPCSVFPVGLVGNQQSPEWGGGVLSRPRLRLSVFPCVFPEFSLCFLCQDLCVCGVDVCLSHSPGPPATNSLVSKYQAAVHCRHPPYVLMFDPLQSVRISSVFGHVPAFTKSLVFDLVRLLSFAIESTRS